MTHEFASLSANLCPTPLFAAPSDSSGGSAAEGGVANFGAPFGGCDVATAERVRANRDDVRRRMAEAAARAGRSVDDVSLVAVTKYASDAEVAALYAAGERCFAENRVPDCMRRIDGAPSDIGWHFIGHLQRNKAQHAVGPFVLVESVDSTRLLERLARVVEQADGGGPLRVLLEFNIAAEPQKHGFARDEWRAALDAAKQHAAFVRVEGLMAMAPYSDDPESSRRHFRALRELRDEMRAASGLDAEGSDALPLPILSMGMSGDFEVAIEEGATHVRVGSALFA